MVQQQDPPAPVAPMHAEHQIGYLLALVGRESYEKLSAKVEEVRKTWLDLLPKDTKGKIEMAWKRPSEMPPVFEKHGAWTAWFHHKLQVGQGTIAELNEQIERLNVELRERRRDPVEPFSFPSIEARLEQALALEHRLGERLARAEQLLRHIDGLEQLVEKRANGAKAKANGGGAAEREA